MGSSNAQQQQFGSNYTQFNPQLMSQIGGAAQNYQNASNQFSGAAQGAAGNVNTNFAQYAPQNLMSYAPKLNSNFQGPNFSNGLDSFSQNLVSQGQQNAHASLAATNQQLASQYGSSNPGLLGALQSQAAINNQLQQNPMMFQAAANQYGREANTYQLGQQAQAQGNQAQLAQSYANAGLATQQQAALSNAQNLHNTAVGQQLQLQALPVQQQQNLLGTLLGLGQATGTQVSTPTTSYYMGNTANPYGNGYQPGLGNWYGGY